MSDFHPTIHMIGNAHIDPVWLWHWQEGYAEVKATFRSALDRMKEFPEFVFTCACAAYYRWVEESDPAMFEEIRLRVVEGPWVIVGGWWIQPDCNIPSGESFARHGLLSQRYFLEKFGVTATVGYNVDSFGHNGMLPQIYKKSGMDAYVMMRPDLNEMNLPANLFLWESPDGTAIPVFRIHINYASWWGEPDPVEWKTEEVLKLAQEQGTEFMNFYGVGNHGGGPTVRSVQAIQKMRTEKGEDSILFSSPNRFFNNIKNKYDLPVVKTDLQHHSSGCYSNHSETKALNRKTEHLLLAAEAFCCLDRALLGSAYPHEKLTAAWEKVLFNQFHDIMGGCSVPSAYEDVRAFYGFARTNAAEAENLALQRIAWAIDTSGGEEFFLNRDHDWTTWEMGERGVPIAVFNPLAWPVKAPVRVGRRMAGVTDDAGKPLPVQAVRAERVNEADKWDALFWAEVPAMGWRVYWAYTEKTFAVEAKTYPCSDTALENDEARVCFDGQTGYILSYLDKRTGVDFVRGGLALPFVVDEGNNDTWAHAVLSFDKVVGRFGDATVKLVENGPVRSVLRVTSRWHHSTLRQDFILYSGSAELEVEARLDWHEERMMLKLAFDTNIANDKGSYAIPFGHIDRPADGEEEPGHEWVSIAGSLPGAGEYSLSLVNDSKYSYDIRPGCINLTAVRSPMFAQHKGEPDEFCEYMDQGMQHFRYALIPHPGDWRAASAVKKAAAFCSRPVSLMGTYHKGPLLLSFGGISVSAQNVVVTAFKRAEDGGGYVLRCYEAYGMETEARFELKAIHREWNAAIKPYSIETYLIPDDPDQPVKAVNLLEM